MKITIELDDAVIRKAVEAQCSAAVAAIITETLTKRAEDIILAKFDRFDVVALVKQHAEQVLAEQTRLSINEVYGLNSWQRRENLRKVVAEQAVLLLTQASKS